MSIYNYLYHMSDQTKQQQAMLSKLGVEELNQMQLEAEKVISSNAEVVLLSPTGTGKTLAFLLPIIDGLDKDSKEIQVLILVPSRELAIQIEQVTRELGSGYKANAVYGGRSGKKDKIDLRHPPAILIGTPGRIADHLRRQTFSTEELSVLVLDEFDKSLEVGFEKEMKEIIYELPFLTKKILTSATHKVDIPDFVGIKLPIYLDYQDAGKSVLQLKIIIYSSKDRLDNLVKLLGHLGAQRGIIFCNFKDTIQIVSDHLSQNNINHTCFYGGLEQRDRERALIKFRNETHRILVATDLAARGIDVPELDFIIHYEIPYSEEEFKHRNGRTARMHQHGTAYIFSDKNKSIPDFASDSEVLKIESNQRPIKSGWRTLFISGGRKDKISKGDIAGLFFKQGGLQKGELGTIELKQDCAFVAVPGKSAKDLINKLNNTRLKKKKVRITLLD